MGMLNFLSKSQDARKIFGERELKIIDKQLKGVNLTQSERNRLSRDIRKKFNFIKEVSVFSKEFELKKGAEINSKIEDALEVILNDPLRVRITKILLFGSVVKKELNLMSDIDLAVVFDKISQKDAFDFRKRVLGRVNNKTDIQVFNILPKNVRESILKNHRVLYGAN